ncbi:16S rRNA methyltransferase rsmB/F domain-containing protein [Hirsutella rhossiliensis]|uniref:16S rRNA methyltransferase rsmB/F domain-containing protein n=1 Tax=Hirsutella rhossiliensis TaxID=111463 RepID=A0A9P8MVL0_9HYPO|nr:16S rRNA methyltransferase rsmB/F domain-containing protein [Hirsutella rhossiliensis]KAH0963008.1 16S rRNA methyltransferase rsmB/F domain-containing protein [Hirsutella rhossiliensis]
MSLYHEAAQVLSAPSAEGGSLKSRIFGRKDIKSHPNQLYALVLETSKWSPVVKEVIEATELLKHERKLTPVLSLLLVHDLLLTKGGIALPQSHGLRTSVERHKGRLKSELTRARLRRKAVSLEALREQVERDAAGEEAGYPRWVRINALHSSIEEQLVSTFSGYARAGRIGDVVSKPGRHLYIDPHVPNLVAVTPGIDMSKTDAYASGKIILQDKASCFPAYLLDPRSEDGDVVDACAAPGNKTTHLASILHQHSPEFASKPQTIFAFEKDTRRAQTLEKMVRIAGSKSMTRIGFGQDFLQVDPRDGKFKDVGALLLDPSCSGSGIIGRDSMPELHRKLSQVQDETEKLVRDDDGNETVIKTEKDLAARLEALSSFQLTLLLHAFQFPAAKKVTYSTCSVYSEENEAVVMAALQSDVARKRGWRILPRDRQVSGMKEWPVRGLAEACKGDATVADGCIRSQKDDGRGVMGFFVAGFTRDGAEDSGATAAAGAEEDPYLRDENGRIVRDVLGMPALNSTGEPVRLVPREDREEGGRSSGSGDEDEKKDDEWDGFGD